MIFRRTFLAGALGVLALTAGAAHAADKTVVVGYQTDALPSSVGIANGDFDKATGVKIDFRRLISGIDEALVVRNGSGINSLADLKGKKLAAAPVSTDHYQLLALIKSIGLNEKDVQVFAIPQPDIVAGYNRGDLDGGFVWDPALTELKKNGKVLVTSREVADKGAPTFSAWVATAAFAKENPGFLKAFAGVIDKYQTSFINDKAAWGPDSDNAKALAKLLGGTPQDQASALKNLSLVPIDAQLSDTWLGGGEKSGLAKILQDTSVFLKDQKKISEVLPSYAAFVTTDAVAGVKRPGT
jgi:taurine transport system substrate-binding protein